MGEKKTYTNNLNSVIIEGKVIQSQYSDERLQFVLSVERYFMYKGEAVKEVIFIDICALGKLAEVCKNTSPGDKVRVVGRLSNLNYLGYMGQHALEVIAEHIEGVGGAK